MTTNQTTQNTLPQMLHCILSNQQTIARCLNLTLPYSIIIPPALNPEPPKPLLPPALQAMLKHPQALESAMAKGYILPCNDGHLQWQLGSKTLLSYFLGRLFCNDYPHASRTANRPIWRQGTFRFPDKMLSEIFGISNLRIYRNRQNYCRLPLNHQLIDELF